MLRIYALKKIALVLGVMCLWSDATYALDKETQLEIRRLEQRIGRIVDANKQIVQDVRQLEKFSKNMLSAQDILEEKLNQLTDTVVKIQNVDIANLRAGQKGLYDQLPLFTWGEDTEECTDIGSKHQQINSVKSKDGMRTLRFLCFDGKAIHLGTEYHGLPN